MTFCASYSINNPQSASYDAILHADVIALAEAMGGPVLAIDTAGTEASVCLVDAAHNRVIEEVSAARALPCETLAQSIADVLDGAGLQVGDLKALVASVGPGSFTGLRVGLATLQGLAMGGHVPMYGVSSLAVLAASTGPGWVSPVCDARRGDVFAAVYQVDAHGVAHAQVADGVFAHAAWAEHLAHKSPAELCVVGDMGEVMGPQAGRAARLVSRRALLCLVQAAADMRAGRATPTQALLPRYLRLSEAERQLAKR